MTSLLKESSYVLLQGLAKAPELNGKLGQIRDEPDSGLGAEGRYQVRMTAAPCQLVKVRLGNLVSAAGGGEEESQLLDAYQKLTSTRLADLIVLSKLGPSSLPTDKQELVKLALQHKLFPDPVDAKLTFSNSTSSVKAPGRKSSPEATPQQSGDDDVVLPGGQTMKRRDMWAQADQMERMTVPQLREQLRHLKSKSPQELRNSTPQMRNLSDFDIQNQISQLENFAANPSAKRAYVESMRTGDFSAAAATGGMDDAALKRDAKAKLALFRTDKQAFRNQLGSQLPAGVTDEEIEASLVAQAEAKTGQALREMRAKEAMATMTDEQLVNNTKMQLKMFNDNPKQFRKQMGPQAASLTDEDIRNQLEMVSKMSGTDLRNMQEMQKAGVGNGGAGINPAQAQQTMENMSGEQLSAMFKMQRDLLKRDPVQFHKMVPQGNSLGMSDEALLTQLDTMANMDPDSLKQYMQMTNQLQSYVQVVKGPLDKVTGGRGNYVLAFLAMVLLLILTYFMSIAAGKLLAWLFPTTFGVGAASAASAATAVPLVQDQAAGFPQNDVILEEEFFQASNDDL
ncbi:hypothetical protein BASA81_004457 [Batrachochytrium salamandrivorans]|nr:hypothetical protein BASA81_004457 [Batrachochytrium salamandrivorans]